MPTVTHGADDSGLSTAKPTAVDDGHLFWATDTLELYIYNAASTSWKVIGGSFLDGVTPGTGAASKAAVLGANGALSFPAGAVLSAATSGAGLMVGGAAAQKLGFWGATAVGQPSTSGTLTGFTASTGTAVVDASQFTGGTGSAAYTVGDVVKALKTVGLLKA